MCKGPGILSGLSRSAINEGYLAHHAQRLGQIRAWNDLNHQNVSATNPNIHEHVLHAI